MERSNYRKPSMRLDPHGNTTTFNYGIETDYYGRGSSHTTRAAARPPCSSTHSTPHEPRDTAARTGVAQGNARPGPGVWQCGTNQEV
jgi:hypothetical protein